MSRVAITLILFGVAIAAAPPPARAQSEIAEPPAGEHFMPQMPAEGAPAESPAGEGAQSRYTFSRVQDGYVRLDNRTGQVSYCGKRTVGWACQLSPDDRAVLENEIIRLQEENAVLKKDLLKRGLPLPSSTKPDSPVAQNEQPLSLPSEPNLDRMKSFVETVWRRLVDLIVTLQKDVLKKS
ncbi:MAG: hypothetical protein WD073_03545 [Xanthobacteraceae bacterium]